MRKCKASWSLVQVSMLLASIGLALLSTTPAAFAAWRDFGDSNFYGTTGLAGDQKPNLVLILADDLGYGDVGFQGQKITKTPRLDQMAREGMVFDQFYAGCTVCAPSRACLLTGFHTGHVWQRFNGSIQFREDPLDLTIATRLQRVGYRTAMIGKSGLACNSDDHGLANRKGFDHFFGFLSHSAAHRQFPMELSRNGASVAIERNEGKKGEQFSSDLFLAESLRWLDQHGTNGPFFLHLALQQPHADLAAPERFVAPYRKLVADKPFAEGNHYRAVDNPAAEYAGMVSQLDDAVGQIIDRLKSLGIAEQTLVLFTSDNGPHQEGGKRVESLNSNGELRGHKRDLYEGGIRVPTVAWWPGRIAPGVRSDFMAAHWDFPATACDLAGADPIDDSDGVSLVPVLSSQSLAGTAAAQRKFLYWEFHEQKGKQAVRLGRWKGIRFALQTESQPRIELYDLESDVQESKNVAAEHPDIVSEIETIMQREHVPTERVNLKSGVLPGS